MGRLASSALLVATLAEMALPFARNVALAHILAPHEFGLGISLSVVYGIAEQATDIGVHFSAVRSNDHDDPDVLYATLHLLMVTRGAALAGLLVLTSPLMALAFDAPEATFAYALLGVSMLIRSFSHLGTKEAMRSYVFWREASVLIGSQIVWTAVTIVAALAFRSFEAVIAGILMNAVGYTVLSHLLSRRRWTLGWHRAAAAEAVAFGRPLIPNGIANAFIQLADRFVIGSLLGVVQLAIYNVSVVTALLPRNAVAKFLNTLFMPAFANLGQDGAKRLRLFDSWALSLSLLGFLYGLGLLSLGPTLIGLIFGHVYQPTDPIMGWIAVNVCAKFLNQLPVPASLAYGQTRFILFGTLASALGVAFGIAVLLFTRDFTDFLGALAAGEVAAVVWISTRTISLYSVDRRLTFFIVFWPILVLGVLAALHPVLGFGLPAWVVTCWTVGLANVAAMLWVSLSAGHRMTTLISDVRHSRAHRTEALTV